jgi:hypothetical protein
MAGVKGTPTSAGLIFMKYTLQFTVGLAHGVHRPGDVNSQELKDFEVFLQFSEATPYPKNPNCCKIELNYGDQRLLAAFDEIAKKTGRQPTSDVRYAQTHRDTHFHVDVDCVSVEEDLKQAPWLYLAMPPPSVLAETDHVEGDDSYILKRVIGSTKRVAFGWGYTYGVMLFTGPLKELFLKSDLKGFGFKLVMKKSGKPSGLWQLESPTIMPESVTDSVSGSYRPPVLRYEEHVVRDMPEFDVAFERATPALINPTLERYAPRRIIVSQRFREVAEKLAPGQFKFGLVAVGEGEELKRRYTPPELAPPDDATL